MLQKIKTLFLKLTLIAIGAIVLALCIFAVPSISKGIIEEFPSVAHMLYFIMFGLWATAVPFLSALYQTYMLLNYIDQNKAFSELSVKALKRIKYCVVIFGVLYAGFMPIVFQIAQIDDAPGLILIFSGIFIGIPIVVAVFTAVLEKLLKSAIEMKSENELTV